MSRKLSPSGSPLAYMGVRPITPAQMVVNKSRRPKSTDLKSFEIGTWWIIPTRSSTPSNEVWIMINKTATAATWIEVDHGGGSVVPGAQYTILTADGSGAYGPNIGPGTAGELLVSQGASANPAFVAPTAGTGLTVTANAGTIEYALDTPVTVSNGGTSKTSFTPYTVVCGGTGATTALQQVSGTGTTGEVLTARTNDTPIWQSPATSGEAITTEYTSAGSGSHTLNASTKFVYIFLVGGGCSGGKGTGVGSGRGGQGGRVLQWQGPVNHMGGAGNSVSYTVGSGGDGSLATTVNGIAGGNTTFGSFLAKGGVTPATGIRFGSVNMTRVEITTGFSQSDAAYFMGYGHGGAVTQPPNTDQIAIFSPSGGGIGGFDSLSPSSASRGGAFKDVTESVVLAGGTAAAGSGLNGGDGNDFTSAIFCGGTGGGGGGKVSGKGGNGGYPGGGGGGGGSRSSSPPPEGYGAGGNGADGYLLVVEYT